MALFALAAPAAAAAAPTSVAIGDSITNGSREEILREFSAAGWSGGVNAISGLRIDQMRPYIKYVANNTPSLRRMFIFGGTNDAFYYSNPNGGWSLQTSINHLHAAVHDVTDVRPKACVFLVTVHENKLPDSTNPTGAKRYHDAVLALNDHMGRIDRAFSKVHLIDWNQYSAGKPWFLDPNEWFGHPNQAGQDALASFYRFFGGLPSNCGPPPPGGAN